MGRAGTGTTHNARSTWSFGLRFRAALTEGRMWVLFHPDASDRVGKAST